MMAKKPRKTMVCNSCVLKHAIFFPELYSVIFLDVAIVDGVDLLFDHSERQKGILWEKEDVEEDA